MKTLLLTLLTVLLPMAALADAVEIDGIYYNLNEDTKEAAVTSNPNKYSGRVNVYGTVTYDSVEYRVTQIESFAFYNCNDMTSAFIYDGVTEIGEYAFASSGIMLVKIPSSVTSIGESAFSYCERLTHVNIYAGGLTKIERNTFERCWGINTMIIPEGVTEIGDQAFSHCSSMRSITLPSSVTSIGEYAFSNCHSLTTITLPSSLTSIGENAFRDCQELPSINIPEGVTEIGDYTFYSCYKLTSVTIPDGVTTIGDEAFNFCVALTTITIGSSVKEIYHKTFGNCTALTDVYCRAEHVPSTYFNPFLNTDVANATLHVPAASIEAYRSTNRWKNFGNIVAWDGQSIETLQYTSPDARIDIYSIDGKFIGSAADQSEAASIVNHLPTGTTAIVRMGEKRVKVLVK